jgi:hypothetical protein
VRINRSEASAAMTSWQATLLQPIESDFFVAARQAHHQ